jgi:4-hydroxy-3-methylbut-2-enyl diphosphate reductase
VEEGYTIVLLGTPGHPEVVGLLGFAPDAILVDEEEDWDRIPRRKRMALICQSTQPPWKFEKLAALMVNRAHELKIINTVCPVTIRRQRTRPTWPGRSTWWSWSAGARAPTRAS